MSVNNTAANPQNNKSAVRVVLIFTLLMLCLPRAVCSVVFGPDVTRMMHARQMLATGLPATAVVVKLKDTGSIVNAKPVVEILFHVTPPDGEPFDANARTVMSVVNINAFQPGHVFNVKYDPQDHSQVAIVFDNP